MSSVRIQLANSSRSIRDTSAPEFAHITTAESESLNRRIAQPRNRLLLVGSEDLAIPKMTYRTVHQPHSQNKETRVHMMYTIWIM